MSSTALVPSLVVAPDGDRVRTAAREALLVAVGVLVIALAAQVVIPLPFTPVPITGQTFAALLVGGAYGFGRGAATFALYLLVGALGAPVYADGAHGTEVLLSATGGYLVGMLLAAALTGAAADRGWDRTVVPAVATMVAGTAVIYLVGATWLANDLGIGAGTAFDLGVQPFLIGDVVKAALAASLLPGAWALLRRVGAGRTERTGRTEGSAR